MRSATAATGFEPISRSATRARTASQMTEIAESSLVRVPPSEGTRASGTRDDPAGTGTFPGTASLVARLASQVEYETILRERALLAEKSLDGELSKEDGRRLRLLTWHLDRIEYAKYRKGLAPWDVAAGGYRRLADEVSSLVRALEDSKWRSQQRSQRR